jgi:hypothetical protein
MSPFQGLVWFTFLSYNNIILSGLHAIRLNDYRDLYTKKTIFIGHQTSYHCLYIPVLLCMVTIGFLIS